MVGNRKDTFKHMEAHMCQSTSVGSERKCSGIIQESMCISESNRVSITQARLLLFGSTEH